MPRMIYCSYLKREAEGLDRVPYPGAIGQRIYENISKDAWQQWLGHQTESLRTSGQCREHQPGGEHNLHPCDTRTRHRRSDGCG